jgi:type IV pilus assembly protein PilA
MITTTSKSSAPGFSLLELMLILAIIGFLILVGLPSYRSYIVRSQIMEGLTLSSTLKQKVVEQYILTGQMLSHDTSPPSSFSSEHVQSIDIRSGGKVVITFKKIDQLSKPTLILTPVDHHGMISWDCTEGSLPHEYRPVRCQKT